MKKIFWVLATVLFLSVMACGGGGSTSAGVQAGKSVLVGPAGKTVTLSDDTIATFDANIVNKSTTVVITNNDDESPIVDSTAITSTYIIEIDRESLADAAGDDSDNNTFITLEIPSATTATLNRLVTANSGASVLDEAYCVAHFVLEYGDEKMDLFGKYLVTNGKIAIRITKSTLAAIKQNTAANKVYNELPRSKLRGI